MMNEREHILTNLNETIETEHGKHVTEENVLTDSELDSFGYALFWIAIEEQYGVCFSKEEVSGFNYHRILVRDIIDRIVHVKNNGTPVEAS